MVPGKEGKHLRYLLRRCDHRGTDVRLTTSEGVACPPRRSPYPALRWSWQPILSWPMKDKQHINVVKAAATVTFHRRRGRIQAAMRKKFLHIVGSMMAAGVLAKGRSRQCVQALRVLLACHQLSTSEQQLGKPHLRYQGSSGRTCATVLGRLPDDLPELVATVVNTSTNAGREEDRMGSSSRAQPSDRLALL